MFYCFVVVLQSFIVLLKVTISQTDRTVKKVHRWTQRVNIIFSFFIEIESFLELGSFVAAFSCAVVEFININFIYFDVIQTFLILAFGNFKQFLK